MLISNKIHYFRNFATQKHPSYYILIIICIFALKLRKFAIFARCHSIMNTPMQKWQILHEYPIQQIFIFGNPVFCLIIVKSIISINGKGDPILIKLLGHE